MAQDEHTQYVIDRIKALVEELEKDTAHVEEFVESMTPEHKGTSVDGWELFGVGRPRTMLIKFQVHRD